MKILAGIILAVFLTGMLVAACFAVVNDDDSMAPLRAQLIRYDEQPRCYDDGCYDDEGDGDSYHHDYSNHDRHRNERRNRGAFSPGPFRDSPVVICAPYSCNSGEQSGGNRQGQPPPDGGDQP